MATPAVGDFDGDGRLDVAYSIVWSPLVVEVYVPEFKVFAFTLEERYREIMGEDEQEFVVDFKSFLPANQQPWSRYMGRYGNGVYQRREPQ